MKSILLCYLDPSVTEEMARSAPIPITHLKVDGFPSKPDDQRIVFEFSTEIGVDPANPTIRFAMSAAAAQNIIAKLQLATTEAGKGR